MAVTVAWADQEQTIIRLSFTDHWTVDELRGSGRECILMIRSVRQPVYVISDFTGSGGLPVGVLWQARSLNEMRPPNWAAGITVTQDPLTKNLLDLFGHIYVGQRRKNIVTVRTNEEALEIIDKLKKEQPGS